MTLPPLYVAFLLWGPDPVWQGTANGTEIRCYDYQGEMYQLTIEAEPASLYANAPVTVIHDDDSQFCESICH